MIETIINLISLMAKGTIYGTLVFGIVAILFRILGQSFSKLSKIALLVIGIIIYIICIIIAYLENIGIFIF